ncbi:MAG TPA: RdgB/HAM1 family non-canonical purine NTP pyrophosphatase [Candidatus Omnitrophota bacterium]|nr:RdgB/HAM1 family non-canonical purine NTP pyrophosphatase [Candidatus Omnitrophota bacterium]
MDKADKPIRLLVATGNQKKLGEFRELFRDFPIQLLSLKDFPGIREVEETGLTFEENARIKALGYASASGCLTLGEDSGISCDALGGRPGVFSARFSGHEKDDQANNRKLLESLGSVPDDQRMAHYTAAIVLAEPGREIFSTIGEVHGFINREPRGHGGFGYDPIFYYPPFGKTFAEIPIEKKHEVSHRSKALRKTKMFLERYVNDRVRSGDDSREAGNVAY